MTLIANYRGLRHDDRAALTLAQRWSKYMAVTFAVGAVTGTVLTFEFGLLWPHFMGKWGEAFGVPFAFEGLFFFTEALFISMYIYGWRRLKPWTHFWTGVPIPIAGLFGSASVVAANAWMNSPQGVTLDSSGNVVDVDPVGVIFNNAMPLMATHMIVAAYVVGGFLIASVYATGMLRGRRDRYHRLGFIIPFTVAAIAIPVQMGVGDGLARWVYNYQPTKFAAIEMVPQTGSDVPETLLGHLNASGEVVGGVAIPGLASWLSDPSTGKATVVQGLDSLPANAPTEHPRGERRPSLLGHHGWPGHTAVLVHAVVLGVVDLPTRHASKPMVPACCCRYRSPLRGEPGSRLDRERGRSPALDCLQHDVGRRRRHRQYRCLDDIHCGSNPLRGARHNHDSRVAWDEPSSTRAERIRGDGHPVWAARKLPIGRR